MAEKIGGDPITTETSVLGAHPPSGDLVVFPWRLALPQKNDVKIETLSRQIFRGQKIPTQKNN